MPMMNENKLTQVIKTSLNKIPLCFLLTQKQPARDFSVWSNFSPKNFQLLNCFHTNLSSLGTQAKSYFARPFSPWLHPNFPDTGGISNPCAPHRDFVSPSKPLSFKLTPKAMLCMPWVQRETVFVTQWLFLLSLAWAGPQPDHSRGSDLC